MLLGQDLRFIRERSADVQTSAASDQAGAVTVAQRAKFLADLNLAKACLMGESAAFTTYSAEAKSWEDSALSELTAFREQAESLLEKRTANACRG